MSKIIEQVYFCCQQFKSMGASTRQLSLESLKLVFKPAYRTEWYAVLSEGVV